MGRFQVIEYVSHFAIHDTQTGQDRPLGDGVDTLFDDEGTPISPGTPRFCQRWAEALNTDESETLAAFFSEPVDQEKRS